MTVKEVAKAFNMSISQLAIISGYSRQGLYDIIEKKCNKNQNRFESFIDHLHFISKDIYEQDMAAAKTQFALRTKTLWQLKEQENEKKN